MSYSERNIHENMAPEFSNVVLEKDGKDSWTECEKNKKILHKDEKKNNTIHTIKSERLIGLVTYCVRTAF
jgi:hypothetical protein